MVQILNGPDVPPAKAPTTTVKAINALTEEVRKLRTEIERWHFEEDVREPEALTRVLDEVEGLRDGIGELAGDVAKEEAETTANVLRMILRDHLDELRELLGK